MRTKELTGRHVFIITASAFAVIIGVNVTLAVKAVSTFPGLEVKNSYVASQTFDRDRAAQEALGWTVEARVEGEALRLSFRDREGNAFEPAHLRTTLGRATSVAQDRSPEYIFDGTALVAPVALRPGFWTLRLEATAEDGTPFRKRLELKVGPDA